jgi:hypothetical protein
MVPECQAARRAASEPDLVPVQQSDMRGQTTGKQHHCVVTERRKDWGERGEEPGNALFDLGRKSIPRYWRQIRSATPE